RRQIAEIVPGEFAFTGGDRNIGGGADLRLAALVVGGDRLLEPGEVVLLNKPAETLCLGDRQRAMRVAHQPDLRPQGFAGGPHAPRRMARVAIDNANPHLDRPKAATRDIAEEFVADLVRPGPAARGIGRHLLGAPPAQQPPDRDAERLAEDVPQRAIDAADRGHRNAAAPEHRKDATLAQRVMGSRTGVERLPQPGDVARVLTPEERREFLLDQAGKRLVLRHAADLRLGLAPPRQAAFGVDAYQGAVERQRPPEIAGVLTLRRDRNVNPE